MAVARTVPKCPFCGKAIAKAICQPYEGVPSSMMLVGDNFIRWEYFDCNCNESKKKRKILVQQWEDYMKKK